MSVSLKSPAKLNLVLDVLGKRPDGFHELKTLFERIDLCDDIVLKANSTGAIRVECNHAHVPKGPKNLAVRIALKLKEDYKVKAGVDIYINKKIPVAAGLAGGSSNGATVLMGLNRLWHLGLSTKDLVKYASALGSDVAFFCYDSSYAVGTGRGEKIKPIEAKTRLWHVLVTPKVKMYTPAVFTHLKAKPLPLNLSLTNKNDHVNILLPFLREGNLRRIAASFSNDLEPAIVSLRPDFIRLKQKFSDAGALGVCFSGSGPSIFALAESQKHANAIRAKFDRRYAQIFVVKTL